MTTGLKILKRLSTCRGPGLVVGRGVGTEAVANAPEDAQMARSSTELAMAGLLAEAEAELPPGQPAVAVVELRATARADAEWLEPALDWLRAHGRRAVLRTSTVMPRSLVAGLRRARATALLELAHPEVSLQRALLGREASGVPSLLLQAQHLQASEIPVAAVVGPLLPAVHDEARLRRLLAHVAAADVRSVHLVVGQLGGGRLSALARALERGDVIALQRAFAIDPRRLDRVLVDPASLPPARLPLPAHLALYEGARRLAGKQGLRVDACGCPAQCHLDPAGARLAPIPMAGPELFSTPA